MGLNEIINSLNLELELNLEKKAETLSRYIHIIET